MSQYYNVPGASEPLRLSEDHAELLGATPVVETVHERPATSARKDEWVAWAVTARGLEPDAAEAKTVAELQALDG